MANPKNEEVLSFKVQADVQTAIKRMSQFERDMRKHLQKVTTASQKMAKTGVDAAEDIEDANQNLLASVKDLDTAYEAEARMIKKLADLQEKKVGATEDETAAIDEQIKSLAALTEGMEGVKQQFKDKSNSKKMAEDLAAAVRKSRELKKGIKDSFKQGFSSFLSKDAKGLTENFGEVLKKGIKLGALGAFAKGGKMQQEGAAMKAAGKAQGGLAGFNKSAGGAMTAGVGKLLEVFSKLGPTLVTVAGILVKVVTMFIDAQAQAKAFNKQILESASTIEIFNQAQGDARIAGRALEDTLDGIRDAAFDASTNLDWGITNETHQQVLNTLTQEGVSLQMMARDAQTAGKTMKDFGAQITTVSVAYSRLLGVPITEISQLQAEMVRDMGMGIEETRLAFATMTKEAEESGMAANKFFAILRGVSADLSLFNLRIAEAAKFLKQVGKTMSARSAQEFLNTIKNYYKGMDLQGRIKATLLAGQGATKGILQKDITRKQKGLVGDVQAKVGKEQADKLAAAMKAGPKETARWMAANDDKLEAGMKEAILDAQRMQAKVTRGGTVDLASALKDLDPMGAVEHLDAISKARFGKPMEKLTDIEMLAFTQMTGVSDQQLDMMAKFKAGLDVTRETIAARVEKGIDTSTEQGKKDQALLNSLGITGSNTEKAEKLRQIDTKKMYENMSKEDREKMDEKAKTMEDYAKDQGKLTTSLLDKLSILVDFVTNQMYDLFTDIWDGVMSIPGVSSKTREQRDVEKRVYQSKDPALIKMLKDTGYDTKKFQEKMIGEGQVGAGLAKAIEAADKGDVKAQVDLKKVMIDTQVAMKGMADKGAGAGVAAIKAAGVGASEAELTKVSELMKAGSTFSEAMQKTGFDPESMEKALQKAVWTVPPEALIPIQDTLKKGGYIEGAKSGAAAPSAQAQAADKAAAPGVSAPAASPATAEAPAAPQAAPQAGAGAAATPSSGIAPPPPLPKAVTDFQDAQLDQLGYLGGQNDDIIKTLKKKVGLNKVLFQTEIAPILEETILDAVRVALVEYKLYKDMDMKDFAEQVKDPNFNAKTFSKDLLETAKKGELTEEYLTVTPGTPPGTPATEGKKAQAGGHIVGQNPDGTAKILRPPAGEMPAFVGPGETVVPKGGRGGGGGVSVTVNGIGGQDLARMVEVAATDAILKYKRREGLH